MITVNDWTAFLPTAERAETAGGAALAALLEARWFANVGAPTNHDARVVRATSWFEAVAHITATDHTDGVLDGPASGVLRILDEESSQRTASAADAAARSAVAHLHWDPYIPANLPLGHVITITDSVTSYVRFLFLEIHAADLNPAGVGTYFRDQLGWFIAGFFPCGWEGRWPEGRARVF